MTENTPFLTIFPGCEDLRHLAGGLDRAEVTDVEVNVRELTLSVCARFPVMPSPVEITTLCDRLREDYGLRQAAIVPDYPRPKTAAAASAPAHGGEAPKGDVLFGRAIRQKPVPMSTLTLESGKVTVEGDVVSNSSRSTRGGGAVLAFDLTDRTNAVSVSRFLRSDDDRSITNKIAEGDHLIVQGEIVWSKYDNDMVLEPRSIMKCKRFLRPDRAEVKRV